MNRAHLAGPRCAYPRCDGHLGKYTSCLAEVLHAESLHGLDEYVGSTTLMVFDLSTVYGIDVHRPILVPAGAYILTEDERGFVRLTAYESENDARDEFERVAEEYDGEE